MGVVKEVVPQERVLHLHEERTDTEMARSGWYPDRPMIEKRFNRSVEGGRLGSLFCKAERVQGEQRDAGI